MGSQTARPVGASVRGFPDAKQSTQRASSSCISLTSVKAKATWRYLKASLLSPIVGGGKRHKHGELAASPPSSTLAAEHVSFASHSPKRFASEWDIPITRLNYAVLFNSLPQTRRFRHHSEWSGPWSSGQRCHPATASHATPEPPQLVAPARTLANHLPN